MQVAADLQAPAAPSHRLLPSATAQQQHLRCPRCDSTNTKFCYYNNYSLSQPRHFCKACKRYWTRGGTLRNVPVGGGCRKNKRVKRLGTPSSSAAVGPSSSSSSNNSTSSLLLPTTATYSGGQTMTLPTSSNLNPFLYTHSLRIPSHEFESVLGNPNVTANEFQPRPPPQPQHSTLPTRSTLLQNYPFLGPSFVSSSSSSYPSSPREINTTNASSSPSPSSLLPFYLHGLQAGVFAGDANLCLLKQETGVLELQPTSSENQLEPWASSAANPLWTSSISTAWTTEPTSTTMFGSSSTTPLI